MRPVSNPRADVSTPFLYTTVVFVAIVAVSVFFFFSMVEVSFGLNANQG